MKKIKTILAEILGQNRSQFIISYPNHHLNLYSSLKQEWKEKEKEKNNSWQPTKEKTCHTRLSLSNLQLRCGLYCLLIWRLNWGQIQAHSDGWQSSILCGCMTKHPTFLLALRETALTQILRSYLKFIVMWTSSKWLLMSSQKLEFVLSSPKMESYIMKHTYSSNTQLLSPTMQVNAVIANHLCSII